MKAKVLRLNDELLPVNHNVKTLKWQVHIERKFLYGDPYRVELQNSVKIGI